MEIHTRLFECSQSKEQESHTKEEVSEVFMLLHIDKYNTNEECHINILRDTSSAATSGESRTHDPSSECGSDVCSENDGNGLSESEQSRIDERHSHDCCCRR